MTRRDYYEVLGVARAAQDKEIKQAYRRLAMEYHPDRNPSPEAEERFKEASEAYEVLSDPDKRRIYDTAGFEGLKNTGFSGFSGAGIDDIFSSFGDIFGDLFGFGGRRRGQRVYRGADTRHRMTIEFEEAVFGCQHEISLNQHQLCKRCGGDGAEPGAKPTRCPTCSGRGQVMHGQGLFLISTTCPDCQGAGSYHTNPCNECRGRGQQRVTRDVTVRIPAGFEDGMSLRYTHEGEPGRNGGPPGDLYVDVVVRKHRSLRRDGDDLLAEARISMVQAALGDALEIQGVDGPERVTIPKGTQPGDVITLRKKGVPRLRGSGRGDLHVICKVEIPKSLSANQRRLLEEFAKEGTSGKKRRLFS